MPQRSSQRSSVTADQLFAESSPATLFPARSGPVQVPVTGCTGLSGTSGMAHSARTRHKLARSRETLNDSVDLIRCESVHIDAIFPNIVYSDALIIVVYILLSLIRLLVVYYRPHLCHEIQILEYS
jgi:hypothetical protein